MFKKTALATSLAILASQAGAATWVTDTAIGSADPVHTTQGITNTADTTGVYLGRSLVRLGAEYAANDEITFTMNMAKGTNASWANSFECVRSANPTSKLVDDASTAIGDNTLIFDNSHGALVGDQFTVAGEGTTNFTITGVSSNAITFTPITATAVADDAALTFIDVKDITFSLVSSSDTAATYRVSGSPSGGTTTVGSLCPVVLPAVKSAGLTGGTAATVAFSAKTGSGTAFDTLAGTVTVGSAANQFVVAETLFNAVVDVEAGKAAFVGGTTTNSADTLTWTYTLNAGTNGDGPAVDGSGALTLNQAEGTAIVASADSVTHTVNGDWSFLDTDATTAGCQTSQITASGTGGTLTVGTSCEKLTLADTTVGTYSLTVTKNVAAQVIKDQTFDGNSVYAWTSAGSTATSTTTYASLGAWTLNGASITVYGVPMGSTVDRMIWINNKGSSAATATATVMAGGSSYGPYDIGSIAGMTSSSVDETIDAALTTAGVTLPANSRANVQIDAPVMSSDITVSASYKVIADNDRLSLETSDTIEDTITVAGTIAPSSDCVEATAAGTGNVGALSGGISGTITNATAFTHSAVSFTNTAAQALGSLNINIDDMDCTGGGGTVATTTSSK